MNYSTSRQATEKPYHNRKYAFLNQYVTVHTANLDSAQSKIIQ